MADDPNRDSQRLSPLGAWLFALIFWSAGSAIVALAVGWIPSSPEKFHAPHWLVGVTGLAFIAGGFAPLIQGLPPDSWASRGVVAGVLLPLAALANWVAFGPGERHFTGELSVAGQLLDHGPVSASGGRIVFGIGAVLLNLMVIAMLRQWTRRRAESYQV